MKNSKFDICFIGNAIVDILSKISDEILHKLEVPKGSMQLVDEELSDKILKIYGFCNVCGIEATKTYRKTEGGERTQVGAANIYEPRCLKHWEPR